MALSCGTRSRRCRLASTKIRHAGTASWFPRLTTNGSSTGAHNGDRSRPDDDAVLLPDRPAARARLPLLQTQVQAPVVLLRRAPPASHDQGAVRGPAAAEAPDGDAPSSVKSSVKGRLAWCSTLSRAFSRESIQPKSG